MENEIKIWKNKLMIGKGISDYIISDNNLDLIFHADKLKFSGKATDADWLYLYNENGEYLGSIWISTKTDMEKVKNFLEETK